jgi:CSLREA domain-containing protein
MKEVVVKNTLSTRQLHVFSVTARWGLALILLAVALGATPVSPVYAADVIVDTTADESDGSCSDGDCSLRDAINTSITGDVIILQAGQIYNLTIPPGAENDWTGFDGTVGDLDVTKALTIQGNGAIINSFGIQHRVFHVGAAGNLTISNVTLTGGINPLPPFDGYVDGIGIFVSGGTINVSDSSFTGIQTHGLGGGIFFDSGTGTVANSTFSNNRADYGGGIALFGAGLQVINSTFSSNSAIDTYGSGGGGAIYTQANLAVTHCTFVSNSNDGGSFPFGSAIAADAGSVVTSVNNLFAGHASPMTSGTVNHTTSYDHGTTVPAWLGSLADNGGATQTHALLSGATNAINQGSGSQPTDQRGYPRDASPDIGSFEYGASAVGPDLEVVKSNDGSPITMGPAWEWRLVVSNNGTASADFGDGQTILSDQLPTTNVSYGAVTVDNQTGISGAGSIACSIDGSGLLACTASGGGVSIVAGTGTFRARFSATPAAAGTFINPSGGSCSVDPGDVVAESNEGDNDCNSDTVVVNAALDFGDAPDPTYPTLLGSTGANHVLGSGVYLGACVDGEPDGQPGAGATGDDVTVGSPVYGTCVGSDDEDGVTFISSLVPGAAADITVAASAACDLSAWIDFNLDGDWTDAGEDIFPGGQALATGTNNLSFAVPAGAAPGTTYARFRCTTDGPVTFTGQASDGEVEDYQVTLNSAPEMDVSGLGNSIADGDTTPTSSDDTDFGPVTVTGGTLTRTFTISNSGTANLTVGAINFTGPAAGDFSVTAAPASPVSPGGTTSFEVTFDPSVLGTRAATVTIANNDSDENPYTFVIEGLGVAGNVLINEVDSDTPSTDDQEFVELFDGGAGNTPLDGLVLVFFNGADDASYRAFDLDGRRTTADGYFVVGNTAVSEADLTFGDDILQNGADAVALYLGNGTYFPNDTPVTTANLLDALVYDTNDADDAGLLPLLNGGQSQVDENGNGNSTTESNQRCPNGSGGQRNTDSYFQAAATPGSANLCIPLVEFSAAGYNVAEGDGTTSVITLNRSRNMSGSSQVQVSITGGTAIGSADYTDDFPKTIIFNAGDTSRMVALSLTDDNLYEPGNAETVTLQVTAVSNAEIGSQSSTTLNISDNDSEPTVTLDLAGSPLAEDGGTATVTATLSHPSTQSVTVSLGFAGTATGGGADYTTSGSVINIPAGSLTGSLTLTGVDDTLAEGTETIRVEITGVTGGLENGQQQVTATITDDDTAGFNVSAISRDTSEDGGQATFTIRLNSEPTGNVVIDVASSNIGEGTVDMSQLTFTPLDWSKVQTVTVTGVDDGDNPDGDVSYTIQLTINTGSTADVTYDGLDPDDVAVINQDNDTRPIYLPLILKDFVPAPDLVVDEIVATSTMVMVTIRNAGTLATINSFWVDLYFDPSVEPPSVNQPWNTVASDGAAWGVTQSLGPNETLELMTRLDAPYFVPGASSGPPFPVGARVYVYVDSINYSTSYGNIEESNEDNNWLRGPDSVAGSSQPATVTSAGHWTDLEQLPPR